MAAGSFQVGQRFTVGGVPHRLTRQLEPNLWVVEDLGTGRFREETVSVLLEKWSVGDLRFYDPYALRSAANDPVSERATALHGAFEDVYRQSYPEHLWKRAQEKLRYIRELEGVPLTEYIIAPRIEEIWEETKKSAGGPAFANPPFFTTVAAWIRLYRDAGNDIRALIDRHHEKGSRESKVDPIVDQVAEDLIDTRYLTLERRSIRDVHNDLRGHIAKLNLGRLPSEKLSLPGFAYLKRKIAEIPPYDRDVARYGKRVADLKFRAAGAGPIAETPLARVCIDHCRVDLMVVDEENGLPLGRPWLTLVLDECTRYVLGFYIGFEEPSIVSVARAVRHAIMPKADQLKAYSKIVNDWDAWGVFGLLVADNGMELHAKAIEQAIGRFGMSLQFCPRRKPWYKGKIERFFGTLRTGLLDKIPGKTFWNIFERGDYSPEKHAIVRLSTLREIVITWIVDVYHQEPHRGLGRLSPSHAWQDARQGLDRWLPASSLSIESAFSKGMRRCLTHKGIEYDCLLYNSAELRALREQHGNEIEVEVRVMDDDLGSVIVVAPDGKELVRVPALDQAYAQGLTRWQHAMCKRYQRRLLDDEAREVSLLVARDRIRELIRRDMDLVKRGSRKRQARFMGDDVLKSVPMPAADQDSNALQPSCSVIPAVPPPIPADTEDELPALTGRRLSAPKDALHA